MELVELTELVAKHWPFDESNYPRMQGLSEGDRKEFALRHILMHQQKAVAKLTEVIEPLDHGAAPDEGKLRQATRNFLINTLRLAAVAGISAEELAASVQNWLSETHVP